jgi:acetyl-CoA synthetase
MATPITVADLERKLETLSASERLEPPDEFREHALLKDPAVYDEAERDPEAWWAARAGDIDWFQEWESVLDDSNRA